MRSTTVTNVPLFFTLRIGSVSTLGSCGSTTRASMPCVERSSSAFAWAAGSGDVFTITFSPGYFFSRAFASSIAWNTTPPVQPWSAVGTETAMVFFSCACAAPTIRPRTARLTTIRFMLHLPLVRSSGRAPGPLGFSSPTPGHAALGQHRDDDDRALNRADEVFADQIRQQHDVADDFEDERAGDRPPHVTHAALEARAADDDGGDRRQFPAEPGRRAGRTETRHVNDDRERNAQALQHIGEGAHAGDVDARIARDVLVRADRAHMASIGGSVENESAGDRHAENDQHRIGHAE